MEVIIKAVDDIKDPTEAHEFLDKFQPKVTSIEIQFSISKKILQKKLNKIKTLNFIRFRSAKILSVV